MRKYFTWTDLRALCISENWFTEGTNEQYDKLRRAFEQQEDYDSLAWIIWTCSTQRNGAIIDHVKEIARKIEEAENDG